jgi:succinate dehydrogenase / fumarate reductase, membrane anchor subunit
MVKSVLSVSHQGLRDWIIQRVSAIVMAIYSIGLITYVVTNPGISFAEWHGLFSQVWMKIATLLVILCMLFHAWIGMWTIFTDYVKPFVIRCLLNTLVFFGLAACFLWGLMILWSV